MANLKKSNIKKKTNRAIEHEMMLAEEERRKQEEAEKKKKRARDFTDNTMAAVFPLYTLLCAILGFLFAQIGIFSLIGIVLGIIGLRRYRGGVKKDRYFWITAVSFAVCVICGGYWIVSMGYILLNNL